MNIHDLQAKKVRNEKIAMVTSYDYWSAKLIAKTSIDMILVGDSLAMIMHGYPSTLPATVEMMALHVHAVKQGAPNKFIVGDLPFLSYRKSLKDTVEAVEKIMHQGANAVKLEGAKGILEPIRYIVESGVPVVGHLGLTPQSIHQLGGHKCQGKDAAKAQEILDDAKALEQSGVCALVLECIPSHLSETITQILSIPTIGIGAGPNVDGQVLVLQDLLGMDEAFQPKFLKKYLNGANMLIDAIEAYALDVKSNAFPSLKESYL